MFNKIFWGDDPRTREDFVKPNFFKDSSSENNVFRIGNEIYFSDTVYDESINLLIKLILEATKAQKSEKGDGYLDNSNKSDLYIFIDSIGGYIYDMFKYVDFIEYTRKKKVFERIITVVTPIAASAASMMAICSDRRLMTRNSTIMIHEMSSRQYGMSTHLKSGMEHLEKLNKQIEDIYTKYTKLKAEEVSELLLKEHWMHSDECLEKGFVDEIL